MLLGTFLAHSPPRPKEVTIPKSKAPFDRLRGTLDLETKDSG